MVADVASFSAHLPRWLVARLLLCGALIGAAVSPSHALNGFDLRDPLIPIDQIHQGGPPKDGIPAIDKPQFDPAPASTLSGGDPVLGLSWRNETKAYPIRILNWHEVVNDRFGGVPVAVTFCPLCGTGVAFDARVGGRELSFGVSGLLYNSDVLLYDRQTNSLWSQIMAQAVTGPMKGQRLTMLPISHTSWEDWRASHPQTLLLSQRTGQSRSYERNPYEGYDSSSQIYFPVAFRSEGFHPKERVLGLLVSGKAKAFPFVELEKATRGGLVLRDSLAGQSLSIRFDAKAGRATAHDPQGRQLAAMVGFWFAWYAFHPQTEIYRAPP